MPVVVSMGDCAASGGYYISANASCIFAQPGTLTGSIGVTGLLFNLQGAFSKLGISADGIDPEGKGDYSFDRFKKFDETETGKLRAMVESVYDCFVGVVAEGRHMDASAALRLCRFSTLVFCILLFL